MDPGSGRGYIEGPVMDMYVGDPVSNVRPEVSGSEVRGLFEDVRIRHLT